ncbi:MAG: hypothetical protein IJS50_01415, partial [Desulfovibrio sp.]|nr:hypothetical protein [Desulfovibrio sp.]
KDYLDLAAIIAHGLKLESGLSAAKALYGEQFPLMEALRTVTYFEGLDLKLLNEARRQILIEAARLISFEELEKTTLLSARLDAKP